MQQILMIGLYVCVGLAMWFLGRLTLYYLVRNEHNEEWWKKWMPYFRIRVFVFLGTSIVLLAAGILIYGAKFKLI